MLGLLATPLWAGVVLAHRAVGVAPLARAGRDPVMTVSLSKQEAAEEAYYRRWFWDQAEEAIKTRFASASKRELKRVLEYVRANRDDAPLPKKLLKNPQYECIGGFFPGLSATPFLEFSGAPWSGLAEAYPAIRREMDALLEREAEFRDVGKPTGWKTMPIYYKGVLDPAFPAAECPATMAAVGKLRLAGETVAFQRQSPGTGLPKHVDPCSWVIACHLGVDCPEEGGARPYISVAGKQYMWEEGAVMLFDPSFKHETFNPTSQERIILNIDVYHPELTDLECEAIALTVALKKELFGSTQEELHESRR